MAARPKRYDAFRAKVNTPSPEPPSEEGDLLETDAEEATLRHLDRDLFHLRISLERSQIGIFFFGNAF